MENQFTPSSIGELKYSIPLYQRLFEWDTIQIEQLLSDLHKSFKTNNKKPYYIGMFTVYKEKGDSQYSLVDGQQRFTVLTLMALAFRNNNWEKFLLIGSTEIRLSFFARSEDSHYLKNKIEYLENTDYTNGKMEIGIKTIKDYVANKCTTEDQLAFVDYIYNQATFFISELPKNYQLQDLNRYFESMNATGKGLENHEILKVELLKKISPDKKELNAKIWNVISTMDKCLIRQKDGESIENFKKRKTDALNNLESTDQLFNLCNDFETQSKDNKDSIKQIGESSKKPAYKIMTRSERSIVNFSEFLLQILWLQLPEDKHNKKTDFFNTNKLLQTFENNLKNENVQTFFDNILKYRIIFDDFIVRISQDEHIISSYFINYYCENDAGNKRNLVQYQSMLFVSTSYHIWLTPVLNYLHKNLKDITYDSLLRYLKNWDNARHNNKFYLDYGSIDRYWFWRLDYYLWENRKQYFIGKSIEIAKNYLFKANRSIEHIAPQHEQEGSVRLFNETFLHNFANLTMISGGQNSALKDKTFQFKKAHVESFIEGSRNGSIESLKMLDIYDAPTWDYDHLNKHNNKMLDVLIDSFDSIEIKENLKSFKF